MLFSTHHLVLLLLCILTAVNALPFEGLSPTTALSTRTLPPYNSNAAKRGLSFHNTTYISNWAGSGSQVSWAYNWDSTMPAAFPKNLEYVPMLWGTGSDHVNKWTKSANDAITRGTTHLLAFNEPDLCNGGGSCISVSDGVKAYRTYMQPFAGKAYLGAPAVTNGPSGMVWLKAFLAACTNCQIDFIPLHWYDSATNVAYFKNYMTSANAVAGTRPLWITEFSGSGSTSQKSTFLSTIIPWIDAQPWIARYAWFWCDASATSAIVDAGGNPTALGKVYGYTPRS